MRASTRIKLGDQTPPRLGHLCLALLVGCGTAPAQQRTPWPAIPTVEGTLAIHVQYPTAGSAILVGDSTFVFGSVGDGRARLTIDGQSVEVAPNGAWLAWIAVPRTRDLTLQLVAEVGSERVTLAHRLTRPDVMPARGAWVDTATLAPRGRMWLPPGEPLPLSVRASPGAVVRLRLPDGRVIPFHADPSLPPVAAGLRAFDRDERNLVRGAGGDRWIATLPADVGRATSEWLTEAAARGAVPRATLEVVLGRDTVRTPWPIEVHRVTTRPWVRLDEVPEGGAWRSVIGRPLPGAGTYTWFFPRGTWARADARIDGQVRLRLGESYAWVPWTTVRPVAGHADDHAPARIGSLTATPTGERVTIRIPLTHPVPFRITESAAALRLTLYDAISVIDWTRYGAGSSPLAAVEWSPRSAREVDLDLRFTGPLWGWRTRIDGSDLLLEARTAPPIDHSAPARGRRVVVDAGHPPLGACGPTGLCEPEVNLAIAERVRDGLRAAGAEVVMSRSGTGSVSLQARTALADSLDADLFVSIHNNALPDGINPFSNHGSSTFYNHLPSLPLARLAQAELVAALGTRDLGVARGDLAVVRPTWYPSMLTEGLFMMVPAHEAALRTAVVQQAYADAVVRAVIAFFAAAGIP